MVVGASARGVDAISRVLAKLGSGFPAPVIIAQKAAPQGPALPAETLARRSALVVKVVHRREALAPGTVYVLPADCHAEISGRSIAIRRDHAPRPRPSVDRFLASAAAAFGEGLVVVILSGLGSEGAAGARFVKQRGGTVVVEDPETARFPEMPRSLAPTTVDAVADADRIGEILAPLLSAGDQAPPAEGAQAFTALLDAVREKSGIDLAGHEPAAIQRRLRRRLAATGARNLQEYRNHLHAHPEELQRLVASFSIRVTSFFRDPDVFAELREHLLPAIVARARDQGGRIRMWSAGCATGEDAYSLAITLCEVLGDELDRFHIRLFATDGDAEAVHFARRGVYSPAALADVPPELVHRYFAEQRGEYLVDKRVRSLVTFGRRDLSRRPPSPHIDLVLCRNVLVHFTPELQERALQLFAFALRDGGVLCLGKAETASALPQLFRQVDAAEKIYRRYCPPFAVPSSRLAIADPQRGVGGASRRRLPGSRDRAAHSPPGSGAARPGRERLNEIFQHVPLGIVTVGPDYDVQDISLAARRLLAIRGIAAGRDLVHAVPASRAGRVALRAVEVDLTALLRQSVDGIRLRAGAPPVRLDLPPGPVTLQADPDRLAQAFGNVLENAVVHAPGTERIDVRLRTVGTGAEVAVRDHGPGVAAADLPRIFDRIPDPASTSRQRTGGLGLGLYICKKLVEAHGGAIEARSTEGEGTVITVWLPMTR